MVEKIVRDFYVVLEVPPNASGEHIGVSFNRLYNQMVALQHSGPQTDEAAASFKELNEAYEVLSDPVKRRAYDKRNIPNTPASTDSIVGRAFGAIASRFGTPAAPTAVSSPGLPQEIMDTIGILTQQGGIEGSGPPMDPRIGDIRWGLGIESKVDRQAACYYRLSVTADDVENGFILHCKSANKDKFKIVMFDSCGGFLFKEHSRGTKQSTEATMFFVSYDINSADSDLSYQPVSPLHSESEGHQGSTHGNDPNSSHEKWSRERDITSNILISDKIDSAIRQKNAVGAGQYLICVYGDNILVKTSFSLIAVRAKNDASEVTKNIM
jgi:curved DNA-binding protein CbpA